jgi:FG-GAP-like repeat
LGDVNGDGKLDLLAANVGLVPAGSNDVSVRLGDGLGGFSGTTTVVTGFNPRSVLLADVNRDGKLDFLATNFGSNTVSVRLNQPGADLVIGESVPQPQADLLLRNPSAGEVRILGLNKNQIAASEAAQLANGTVVTPGAEWKLVSGKSDFNGDNIRDFVWFNTVTGESAIWYMQKGSTGLGNIIGSASLVYLPNAQKSFQVAQGWQLTAVENLLGDSRPEFLWEERGTGSTAIWQLDIASNSRTDINLTGSAFVTLNGATIQTGGIGSGWKIAGLGNFTVNSSTKDILWFNEKTAETAVWKLNGTALISYGFVNSLGERLKPVGWRPVAIGNLDGVGPDEIVWQSGTTVAVWNLGSNYEVTDRSVILNQRLASGEQVQALADLNLDGSLDLVVRQKASDVSGIPIYYLNKTTFQLATPTQFLVQPPATTAYSTGDRRFDIIDAVDLGGPLVTLNLG